MNLGGWFRKVGTVRHKSSDRPAEIGQAVCKKALWLYWWILSWS